MSEVITIIGGGPGGYVAAIRAAQLGAEVHLVEQTYLGGTCLNVGCIPTKALLHTANLFREVSKASKLGVSSEHLTLDWGKAQKNKGTTIRKLVRGVEGLLAANGVTVHKGHAVLADAHTVQISGGETIQSDKIILASGSKPAVIPFPGHDLPGVLDSTGALELETLPESICILGGGVIGCEFAALLSAVGVKVTIVEMLPQILPSIDAEIAGIVQAGLMAQGVTIHTGTRLERVEQENGGLLAIAGGTLQIPCEKLIVAVGRRVCTEGMGLEEVGVKLDRGVVVTNEQFQTSVPNIYAIGDCNGKIMLAHAASAQGEAAAEHCMGLAPHYDGAIVPNCVYTNPEAAGIGLTEQQAKADGISYKVGRFPLSGNGKSMIEGCTNGLIKIIAAQDGTILGAHMVGPRVTDMIAEFSLAMTMKANVADIEHAIHPHPTVSEAVAEAALDVNGRAIHWPPKG